MKTISLPEDVYLALKRLKLKGETLPYVLRRLLKIKKGLKTNIDKLAGALAMEDEWDCILEDLYHDRQKKAYGKNGIYGRNGNLFI